jgi:hypothetical protein
LGGSHWIDSSIAHFRHFRIYIDAALLRREPLDHRLFFGFLGAGGGVVGFDFPQCGQVFASMLISLPHSTHGASAI